MIKKKLLIVTAGAFVLYAASAGVSFVLFNTILKSPVNISAPFIGSLTDVTSGQEEGVKDQPCPLNGAMYTKNRKGQWEKRRPLGVMIENHQDARPINGWTRADVVYEAVAEGGITRTLTMYYCQDAGDIAPIRSALTYFLDWLSEYSALYAHVGGANTPGPADALGQIKDYGILDMDQFGLGFPTYWRGTDKLAPHNVHSTTKKLWEAATARGEGWGAKDKNGDNWDENFVLWQFKNETPLDQRGIQKPINVPFWTQAADYTVTWKYDKATNTYKRYIGSTAQVDPTTKEVVSPKNVIVQFQVESDANDGYPDGHLLYDTIGTGKALFFIDGKAVLGTWNKASREARTKYLDVNGQEIQFNRGQIWIETIPAGNTVTY